MKKAFALLCTATGVQAPERHGPAKLGEQMRSALDPSRARAVIGWQAEMPLADAYKYASEVMVENMLARDAEEGIKAFIEKREPKWQDR